MAFRLDTAVNTLRKVMDILAREWPVIEPVARARVQATVSQHAREVASVPASIFANRLVSFLQALWDLRDLLPADAVETLAAGQGVSQRLSEAADTGTRQTLLASILRVTDPRWYPDAMGLAQAVSGLLHRNQDRLGEPEQAAWHQLEAAYHQTGDADSYLRAIGDRLGRYPAIGGLLEQGRSWQPATPTVRSLLPDRLDSATTVLPALEARGEIGRYANIHFPGTVLLSQQMVPLIVYVAADFRGGAVVGQDAARLTLAAGDLTLVLQTGDFRLAGVVGGCEVTGMQTARTVQVLQGRDCEPVIFFLSPSATGVKRLSIDVYQLGRNVGTLAFETEVVDQATATKLDAMVIGPAQLAVAGGTATPPDLELRVALAADCRTLSYTLHSPGASDYNFKPAGQVTLNFDPREILQRYVERLNQMARTPMAGRRAADTRRALHELADMGANLYQELFSRELKDEYRKLRRDYAGKSLLITSDEPWIPWELVRPVEYDERGTPYYDDPFLCEKFQVSRWLAGRGAPDRVVLHRAAVVVPVDNLAAANDEADYFARLYREKWDFQVGPALSSVAEVDESFIDGNVHLYHFACHGNFDTQDPNESKLKLADGFLRPSQVVGARQAGLRRARPLIFLNACYTGEVGFALTGLGGWAERFLEAGASIFIGSLWEINDQLAARFAAEFYNRLWGVGGQRALPLGEAFHGARLAIKLADPANPTWLAYVLYGDPKCTVMLGRPGG